MRTCIHAHMHTCTHPHIHTSTHAHIHTSTHAQMHTCTHAQLHKCTHAHMHTCMHTYMHKCSHAHMHTCMHTYMRKCSHAHILTPNVHFTYNENSVFLLNTDFLHFRICFAQANAIDFSISGRLSSILIDVQKRHFMVLNFQSYLVRAMRM